MNDFNDKIYQKRIEAIIDLYNELSESRIPRSILLRNENKHKLLFIVSSVAIEDNTFTTEEAEKLIYLNQVCTKRSYNEHLQIMNYHNAYNEMLELSSKNAAINIDMICGLHKLVSEGEIKSDGSLRTGDAYIGDGSRVVHTPISAVHVEDALNKAIKEYNKSKEYVLTKITKFHLAFENVHPFEDGNGRVGRLLMNYQLLQNDYFQIHIPNNKRSLYMSAFRDYNRNGKIDKMLDIISREQEKTIENIKKLWDEYRGKNDIDRALDNITNENQSNDSDMER